MAIAAAALAPPAGHPVREGHARADHGDVKWALTLAANYVAAGGRWELVEAYVDEWLDYDSELRAREEIEAL